MLARSSSYNCVLRPHVKTHKTIPGALLQTSNRRSTITVSTLREAEFFQEAGFTDILYAVPIDPSKIIRAKKMARHVHVTVDNIQQVAALINHGAPAPGERWSVVVMVDSGYGRDGVVPSDVDALELARAIDAAECMELFMLYTHAGHSYDVPYGDVEAIVKISEQERDAVVEFKKVRSEPLNGC